MIPCGAAGSGTEGGCVDGGGDNGAGRPGTSPGKVAGRGASTVFKVALSCDSDFTSFCSVPRGNSAAFGASTTEGEDELGGDGDGTVAAMADSVDEEFCTTSASPASSPALPSSLTLPPSWSSLSASSASGV